jgi:hypothetical protein
MIRNAFKAENIATTIVILIVLVAIFICMMFCLAKFCLKSAEEEGEIQLDYRVKVIIPDDEESSMGDDPKQKLVKRRASKVKINKVVAKEKEEMD